MKEAVETKKVDEKLEKANDPNVKPSERMDAEFEANKAAAKAAEHHAKAEEHKNKHCLVFIAVVASILFGLSFIGNQIIYRWLVNTTGIIGFIA
ncbi:unnamed protein product [Rotaria sordida]|uniref:Uncharacterized protein n=1 Tax=Rotaria sordida TaxID=392033 RepID=A0A815D6G1_9BILA|nr:unnamed protein product [Rotaria sordida]